MKKLLLPIKPCYVSKIIDGSKRVEYRKSIASDRTVRQVLIYATRPVMRVVAEFTIEDYFEMTPEQLWIETSEIGGISKEKYMEYFSGHEVARAYKISAVRLIEPNRTLKEYGINYVPQNFCYVND